VGIFIASILLGGFRCSKEREMLMMREGIIMLSTFSNRDGDRKQAT